MCFEGSLPLLTYGVLCTDLIHFRENANAKGTMFIYRSKQPITSTPCFQLTVCGTGSPKARLRLVTV